MFHPRRDVWDEHFGWSSVSPGQLIPKTPVRRATVIRLRLIDPVLASLGRLLAEVGLFDDVA